MTRLGNRLQCTQRGAAIVEFALVSVLLVTLLVGILQFGIVLFTFNSAIEATRRGARLTVVSSIASDADIVTRTLETLPLLDTCDAAVARYPMGCDLATCTHVRVSLSGCTVAPWFFWPIATPVAIPPFSTALPRESLGNNGAP